MAVIVNKIENKQVWRLKILLPIFKFINYKTDLLK